MTDFARLNNGLAYSNGDVPDQTHFNNIRENLDLLHTISTGVFIPSEVDVGTIGTGSTNGAPTNMTWSAIHNLYIALGLPTSSHQAVYCAGECGPVSAYETNTGFVAPYDVGTDITKGRVTIPFSDVVAYIYPSAASSYNTCVAESADFITWTNIFHSGTAIANFFNIPNGSPKKYVMPVADVAYIPGTETSAGAGILKLAYSGSSVYTSTILKPSGGLGAGWGPRYIACNTTHVNACNARTSTTAQGMYIQVATNTVTYYTITLPTGYDIFSLEWDPIRLVWVAFAYVTGSGAKYIAYTTSSNGTTWSNPWLKFAVVSGTGSGSLVAHDAKIADNGTYYIAVSVNTENGYTTTLITSLDAGATWYNRTIGRYTAIESEYPTFASKTAYGFATGGNSILLFGALRKAGDYKIARAIQCGVTSSGTATVATAV